MSAQVIGHDYAVRLVDGCAEQLLLSHSEPSKHPDYNGLSFPQSFESAFKTKLETDRHCWREASGMAFCPSTETYPISDMNWCLGATKGCLSNAHIDSSGFATTIEVMCGRKHWFLGVPLAGDSYSSFASIDTFFGEYDFDQPNPHRWRWESVYLDSTTVLYVPFLLLLSHLQLNLHHRIMRPNTLHAVATPEASLVRGKFFYSAATLRDTVYGALHDCLYNHLVTNTQHQAASIRTLYRILSVINEHLVWGKLVAIFSVISSLASKALPFQKRHMCPTCRALME
jgi:hypothetical protein